MENETAQIAIYTIEEERVVLATGSMMGNANDSMVVEAVIVFNVMDEGMQEGIILRCFFTPNGFNVGFQFDDLESVVLVPHGL